MKKSICLLLIMIASTTYYLWRDNVSVNIIAIHQNKYTAEILTMLELVDSAKALIVRADRIAPITYGK